MDNLLKTRRVARGWSQEELSRRAGISRTGVSAIESGRLVPSVAAALSLASVLECSVEAIFGGVAGSPSAHAEWAWSPKSFPCRYWQAEVGGRNWLYPVESTPGAMLPQDGSSSSPNALPADADLARRTLVLASCDPAVSLLATEYARQTGFRMLTFSRSSQVGAELLAAGKIHVAGTHVSRVDDSSGNLGPLRAAGFTGKASLVRVARWEEGIAQAHGLSLQSSRAVRSAKLRWIGREPGSAARRCLDELLDGRPPPRREARDHRGVAQAIRDGWADAGVCVRLASDEAQLGFLPLWNERYDLCFAAELAGDPRLAGLVAVVRSRAYRRMLDELPGYDPTHAGEMQHVVLKSK